MRVSFAAAGTAGHIEPALALAHWLKKTDSSLVCDFIGSSAALDSALMKESGFTLHPVRKAPFPRKLSPALVLWPIRFTQSLIQISRIIEGTDLVVGFGGYVCAPTYLMARLKKIPILIHEANAKPGMANDLGRRLGARLTIAFNSTRTTSPSWGEATLVGMPVRKRVQELSTATAEVCHEIRRKKAGEWGFDEKRPIVLVFGGSQGSRAINHVIESILTETERAGIQIIHAVGKANDFPARNKNYFPVHYISDMAESMVASDIAITRGGAVTCAELGILRTYGVIIPLAIGNGEQEFNSLELTSVGAATLIDEKDFTPRLLSEKFFALIKSAKDYRETTKKSIFEIHAEEKLGQIALSMLAVGGHR